MVVAEHNNRTPCLRAESRDGPRDWWASFGKVTSPATSNPGCNNAIAVHNKPTKDEGCGVLLAYSP